MTDLITANLQSIIERAPWLAHLLAVYVVLHLMGRPAADLAFIVADVCGIHKASRVCKMIGLTAWRLGVLLQSIALGGTSPRYLSKRFQRRTR